MSMFNRPMNIADPVEFAAEEYECAMMKLDTLQVPKELHGRTLSIVGRISYLAGEIS